MKDQKKTNNLATEADINNVEDSKSAKNLIGEVKEIKKRNQELEKKINNLEKKIKSISPHGGRNTIIPYTAFSIILLALIIVSNIYLNDKIENQSNTPITKNTPQNNSTTIQNNTVPKQNSENTKNGINEQIKTNPAERKTKQTNPRKNETVKTVLTTVPNVKGLNVEEAKNKLKSTELNVTVIKVSFGEENINKVVRQNPKAGERVQSGSAVIIQVGE